MSDNNFPGGLWAYAPHANAPGFVKCALSIDKAKMMAWLETQGDSVRIQVLEKKDGTGYYAKIDDFKPEKKQDVAPQSDIDPDDDIPF